MPGTGWTLILGWLRANPLAGRLAVKLVVALSMGLAAGLVLVWLCAAVGLTRNVAAVGAALAALAGSARVSPRLAERLRIPEPDGQLK